MEEIKELDQMITKKRNSLSALSKKLSDVESSANDMHALVGNLPAMQDNIISLRADIAMGEARQDDLDQAIQELDAAKNKIDEYQQLVDGLKKKMKDSSSALRSAESKINILIEKQIRQEAEKLGAEYLVTANDLIAKFRQLMGVIKIHDQLRGTADPIGSNQFEPGALSIPVFRLASIGQHPNVSITWPVLNEATKIKHQYGLLYAADDFAAAKKRLIGLGLPLKELVA